MVREGRAIERVNAEEIVKSRAAIYEAIAEVMSRLPPRKRPGLPAANARLRLPIDSPAPCVHGNRSVR
jgi:hypothetical protein